VTNTLAYYNAISWCKPTCSRASDWPINGLAPQLCLLFLLGGMSVLLACPPRWRHFCPPGVNFTNILWAAFVPKSFCKKNPNFKHIKAAQRALVWLSISLIFYEQFFHSKVLYTAFMCSQFGFLIFWRKDFGAKAAHTMLVKWTPGLPLRMTSFIVYIRNN
jgi:hypothetical protein